MLDNKLELQERSETLLVYIFLPPLPLRGFVEFWQIPYERIPSTMALVVLPIGVFEAVTVEPVPAVYTSRTVFKNVLVEEYLMEK